MKRKTFPIKLLFVLVLSFVCFSAVLGCGGKEPDVPEVKILSFAAADEVSTGKTGAVHSLVYSATSGSKVATSVMIGDSFATMADYSYVDGEYIFHTAGEFTVTVYASKDGMLGHDSVKLTVSESGASVSDVAIVAAAGETLGRVRALHVLNYTASPNSEVSVEIKKGDSVADDAVYNAALGTVIFGSAGKYTVTVTATVGSEKGSSFAEIEIVADDAPSVVLTANKSSVAEDEEVTLMHTVTYKDGDVCESEKIKVQHRSGGNFAPADPETYTLCGDRFTPHFAGEWKITYVAEGTCGAVGEGSVTVNCEHTPVTLSAASKERRRIQTGKPVEVGYLVSGKADKYDITFDTNGHSGVTAEKGEGNSLRVTASEPDYFTVTVVYTHKTVPTVKKTVDMDFYSVDSLAYAPAWGDDPFDGMPSEVLTSMGYLLYFDAVSCGGPERKLTARDASYEVTEHNVTAASGGTGVELLYAAGDENYPYVIVSNFDHNVAEGDFTLKMTVTDPYTGYSAVATKKFTVVATGNNYLEAPQFIQNYLNEHSDFFRMSSMNFDNAVSDCRQNMVLTKTGTIMQRTNPSWALHDDRDKLSPAQSRTENADFAHMDLDTASSDCRLEFKFNLLAPNPTSGEVWLGIGVRTVTSSGWAGFFDLHIVDGKLDITNGFDSKPAASYEFSERQLAVSGAVMYVRIDRKVSGNNAEYTVYVKTEENDAYERFYRCTYAKSTSAGNPGAPLKQYQFTHRSAGGCYSVEDVTLTDFNA